MSINRLTLTNFRNHADIQLAPAAGLVVLTGENGAGKTNILEALSLLVPGRGLRGTTMGMVAQQNGPGGFAIAARLDGSDIGVGTLPQAPERRIVRINGATCAATALSEWLSVVWLTPAMDRIFADAPSERRRFLDRLVLALDPAHAVHSARYEAAMRQRTRLLLADERPDPQWLAALEHQMAQHGSAISKARLDLISSVATVIADSRGSPFPQAELMLTGWEADHEFEIRLFGSRARDAAAGRALVGPHRQDLGVTHAAKRQAAALCSTGEQTALLLSIVLAHAKLVAGCSARPIILLLDEVAAHLDSVRREALFEALFESGNQVWLTGTDSSLFPPPAADCAHFQLSAGGLIRD